jgi:hypothetical protein
MDSSLKFNICNLPSSFLCDNEVQDLKERIEQNIGVGLQYACNFWVYHFAKGKLRREMVEKMGKFVKIKVLFWIEAMSIMGRLSECVRALDLVFKVSKSDIFANKFTHYLTDLPMSRNESYSPQNQGNQRYGCSVQFECC